MSKIDKLEICKRTRKIAADSLYKVLEKLLSSNKPISEVMLRDTWLSEMRKNKNIFPDGWYLPPPNGIIVLIADDKSVERLNYKSVRPQENWPRDDVFLNTKNGIIYCYSSPVDKKTGIIGDFGATLYFGNNKEIQSLLKLCLSLDKEIFDYAKIGMKLSHVRKYAQELFRKYGLKIDIEIVTKNAHDNIGHSIPATDKPWSKKKLELLKGNDWIKTKDMISNKRIFLSHIEPFVIKEGFGVTIEPRPQILAKPYLPKALSYHTIALFKENGEKEFITGFDDLFRLAEMDYML